MERTGTKVSARLWQFYFYFHELRMFGDRLLNTQALDHTSNLMFLKYFSGRVMIRKYVIYNFAQRALWLYIAEAVLVLAIVMIARVHM